MAGWRDELVEVIKSSAEREAEEAEKRQKRLEAALTVADEAMVKARASLEFVNEQLASKAQPVALSNVEGGQKLSLHGLSLEVALSREDAVVRVSFNEGRPREFDFVSERHLAPRDVEEYVGRRSVELARAAQKGHPW